MKGDDYGYVSTNMTARALHDSTHQAIATGWYYALNAAQLTKRLRHVASWSSCYSTYTVTGMVSFTVGVTPMESRPA
jgi:hypothetical protein